MNTIERKQKKGTHLNDKHTVSPQKLFNNSSTILANHQTALIQPPPPLPFTYQTVEAIGS